jgi:serine/threonine protein kinase
MKLATGGTMVEQYSLVGDEQLREYSDLEELGSSPLSVVYAATELSTRREVVLRVLLVDTKSPVIAEVLDREVVGLGALWSHPSVVTLLRVTVSSDGRPVLVFERCKESVATRLKDQPLSPEDVTSLGMKVAGGLECAHRQGILHRDIKPKSIFLTEFDEPALGDFGMARLEAASQFTVGAIEVRTPHTPPEVLEGRPPTAVSDVYGLASTMYQLLVGRSPFRSDDLESTATVMMRILRDDPPPLPPSVPADLAEAIYGALAKDPSQRPSGALAFAAVLSGIEEANGWGLTCPVGVEAHLPHRPVQVVLLEPVQEAEAEPEPISAIGPEPVIQPTDWPPPNPQPVSDPESLIWARPEERLESPPPVASGACPNGHQMPANARFCGVCGSAIVEASTPVTSAASDPVTTWAGATTQIPAQPKLVCRNGHLAPIGAEPKPFCRICGAPMLTECEEGHQMPAVATFCPVCGRRSANAPV